MRRTIKYFFIFLALVLLALLAFVATFDANNYKPQIIEQVEQATGRDFTIEGDINLSIFPWIGLKVENVTLGNEKGFSAKQFAAIKQLDVKVNVLPLLKKQVEINVIRLHGLDVSLEVAKDKSNNWSSLSQAEADADKTKAPDETAAAQTEQTADEEKGSSPLASLKVEGFEFVDAVIRYDDRSSNTSATVSELNLTTTAITFDQPVELEFGARIENNQPAIDTRLKLTTQLVFNQDFTEFKLRDLVFTILAKANEFIKQDEEVEIKSDVDVLMDEQRITLKQLQISALGTNTNVEITVSQFLETPMIQGSIEIQAFDARKVARRAGVELPEMAKADALSRVAIKTKLKLQGEKLQANEFNLKLDDSTLSGWLHVTDISKQQLRYDLAFDQLNINDYLPPAVDTPADIVASGGATTADAASGNEKIELPVEIMRELDIQGDFRIASLTAKEYDIKQFLMSLKAQNGVILEGQVLSAVNINVQKTVPAYAIGLDVNRVQIGPVVNPFLESVMGDEPLKMQGAVNLKMDVATAGESVKQLKKASKGQIVLDMKETAVDGFDPEFYMRKSIADYVNEKGFGLSKTIMGSYKPREVTVFDKIYSTINLADGKARTDDFLMDSKRVQIKADGYADIVQNKLDVNTSVRLPRGKTVAEKIFDEPLYVRVYGPFDALEYEIDKNRLKKSTTDVLEKEVKAKAKAKLDAEKQRLKEKADKELKRSEEKVKQKLQDKLKDTLKGLF